MSAEQSGIEPLEYIAPGHESHVRKLIQLVRPLLRETQWQWFSEQADAVFAEERDRRNAILRRRLALRRGGAV